MVKRVKLKSTAVAVSPKRGAPTKYQPAYNDQVQRLLKLGMTEMDVALVFDVSPTTVRKWKADHPEFFLQVAKGKQEADQKVAASLFKNATGFYYYEDQLVKKWRKKYVKGEVVEAYEVIEMVPVKKYSPPNVTAEIFFLKNRRPELWRDVQYRPEEKDKPSTPPDEIMKEMKKRGLVVLDGVYEVSQGKD